MNKDMFIKLTFASILILSMSAVVASDQEMTENEARQQVYGWKLMSIEERAAHRAKMRSFDTEKELEAYRNEHHQRMQARAMEKGVNLAEMPMMRGRGQMGGSGPR